MDGEVENECGVVVAVERREMKRNKGLKGRDLMILSIVCFWLQTWNSVEELAGWIPNCGFTWILIK